ncbi:uncharacterized protein ColSpa_11942 [Colletotrichum spaethianum]|uniref:Uncharacterized protein n=1 Tax=Colletotrichum spaethianum TaxID=700344 RepID=A0AA37PG98_9PEZI|nr:uncharacterized protein ColSpa_11942 [Colletotrichum spaethianum]GKT51761.1 hypothetical protein ColSpa_11942 [Colletotrichum spaethianum]
MALPKNWRFTKRSEEVILVRDLLEMIVDWINSFKAIGDTVGQFDPTHAALTWAAVRFLLQIAVSEVELFGALVNDCIHLTALIVEYIARMMVRYRAFEAFYLRGSQSEMEKTLGDFLVHLYAEILTHPSYAVMFFEKDYLSPGRHHWPAYTSQITSTGYWHAFFSPRTTPQEPFRSIDRERKKIM